MIITRAAQIPYHDIIQLVRTHVFLQTPSIQTYADFKLVTDNKLRTLYNDVEFRCTRRRFLIFSLRVPEFELDTIMGAHDAPSAVDWLSHQLSEN